MAAAGERVAEAARISPRLRRGAEARGPHRPILREAHAGGSEACMPFGGIYCSADGSNVKRLELESSRLGPYEGGVKEVYRPKRPLASARAKKYIRIL
jgi:hypothetical protein